MLTWWFVMAAMSAEVDAGAISVAQSPPEVAWRGTRGLDAVGLPELHVGVEVAGGLPGAWADALDVLLQRLAEAAVAGRPPPHGALLPLPAGTGTLLPGTDLRGLVVLAGARGVDGAEASRILLLPGAEVEVARAQGVMRWLTYRAAAARAFPAPGWTDPGAPPVTAVGDLSRSALAGLALDPVPGLRVVVQRAPTATAQPGDLCPPLPRDPRQAACVRVVVSVHDPAARGAFAPDRPRRALAAGVPQDHDAHFRWRVRDGATVVDGAPSPSRIAANGLLVAPAEGRSGARRVEDVIAMTARVGQRRRLHALASRGKLGSVRLDDGTVIAIEHPVMDAGPPRPPAPE